MSQPFRSDIDALASRHASLEHELAVKTREVAEAARQLAEAQDRAKRAVLDNVRVATPCPASWADMTGDDRVRACAICEKNVYNLSDLTREEAERLIVEKEGKLCVRYYQRKDGTILLKDCAVGLRQKRKRRVIAAGALLLLGGSGVVARQSVRQGVTASVPNVDEIADQVPDPIGARVHGTGQDDAPPPAPLPRVDEELEYVPVMGRLPIRHWDP